MHFSHRTVLPSLGIERISKFQMSRGVASNDQIMRPTPPAFLKLLVPVKRSVLAGSAV